ncbi:Cobalt-zinc-cadmium resistance protein [uncultured Coleofasciculus sp.]|uniref:Cobalt-zinc-cadmium resistance protein n=1 Tax=uncultured Coleofasciculus sp. TaxID=1267456 RepID=A0A6J4I2J3_9CYAN|nr:Cobalt-zinc-cadmium resistance protein [uncultured Coleofasciculus sp.]
MREIFQGAIERIFSPPRPVIISAPELWLLLIVLGINIFVTYYERSVGKRVGSSILIADAQHTMSDVWVTITVLAGLIAVWQGSALHLPQLQWLDVILSFPVALLVFRSGWNVLKDNLPWLVDEMAIAPEAIQEVAMQVPDVINCHDIASRGLLGRQVFIEMHMIVAAKDVETAHQITEDVENLLEERFNPVRVLIHVEPPAYQSNNVSFEAENSQTNS